MPSGLGRLCAITNFLSIILAHILLEHFDDPIWGELMGFGVRHRADVDLY